VERIPSIDPTKQQVDTPWRPACPFGSGSSSPVHPGRPFEPVNSTRLIIPTGTVTGAIINSATGTLSTPAEEQPISGAAGQPTWCTASGTLF